MKITCGEGRVCDLEGGEVTKVGDGVTRRAWIPDGPVAGPPYFELSSRAKRGICFLWDHDRLQEFDRLSPVVCKVVPRGILPLDQCDAFSAIPALDFLLAANGVAHVGKDLEAHQPIDSVPLGKALDFVCLVLLDSPLDVVAQAGVNAARLTRHDVRVEAEFACHGFLPACSESRSLASLVMTNHEDYMWRRGVSVI